MAERNFTMTRRQFGKTAIAAVGELATNINGPAFPHQEKLLSPENKIYPGDVFHKAFNGDGTFIIMAYGSPTGWGSIAYNPQGADRGGLQNTIDTFDYLSAFVPAWAKRVHRHADVIGSSFKKINNTSESQAVVHTESLALIYDILNGKAGANATASFSIRAGRDVSMDRLFDIIQKLYQGKFVYNESDVIPNNIFINGGIMLGLDIEEMVNPDEFGNAYYPTGVPADQLHEIVSWVKNFMVNRGFEQYSTILYEQGIEPHIPDNPRGWEWNDKIKIAHAGFQTTASSSAENRIKLLQAIQRQKEIWGVTGIGGMVFTHALLEAHIQNAMDNNDIKIYAEGLQALAAQ